jgi:MoxR-like ATPase
MNVKQLTRTLLGLPIRKSVLIRGAHGIGKSEIVAQCSAEKSRRLAKPFGFIDIRLAQYEVGDLLGLQVRRDKFTITKTVYKVGQLVKEQTVAENVSVHDLPLWFPTDPDSAGILFLDELDRAPKDIQNWALQLILDYTVNFNPLPAGWQIISAGNGNPEVYNTLILDSAMLDRFLVIDFQPLAKETLEEFRNRDVWAPIVKYLTQVPGDLYPPDSADMEPGGRYQSPRSWVSLSDAVKNFVANGDDVTKDIEYLDLLAAGYLGPTVALNFVGYLRKEYKVYSSEDILDQFGRYKDNFESMEAPEIGYYNTELTRYIKKMKDKLSPVQCRNLFSYVKAIPRETAMGFWSELLQASLEQARHWLDSNKPAIGNFFAESLGGEKGFSKRT